MHELALLLAIIGLLLGVMAGLAVIFRRWLIQREALAAEIWGVTAEPGEDAPERRAGIESLHDGPPAGDRAARATARVG